jgi:hypothetical protein
VVATGPTTSTISMNAHSKRAVCNPRALRLGVTSDRPSRLQCIGMKHAELIIVDAPWELGTKTRRSPVSAAHRSVSGTLMGRTIHRRA